MNAAPEEWRRIGYKAQRNQLLNANPVGLERSQNKAVIASRTGLYNGVDLHRKAVKNPRRRFQEGHGQ